MFAYFVAEHNLLPTISRPAPISRQWGSEALSLQKNDDYDDHKALFDRGGDRASHRLVSVRPVFCHDRREHRSEQRQVLVLTSSRSGKFSFWKFSF